MEVWAWGSGIGFMVLAWVVYVYLFPIHKSDSSTQERDWTMSRLWEGFDGRASFSKFQFWLWTWVITLCLVSVWVARMIVTQGVVSPIDDIPETLLGLLGLSGGTSIWAKGITTQYVNQRLNKKPVKKPEEAEENKDNLFNRTTRLQELLAEDSGAPELAKMQMFLFTLVAVVFFVITVADRIHSGINGGDVQTLVLPDLDRMWLVLMGISAGGYIGKKYVTRERPIITSIVPSSAPIGKRIMVTGRALGDKHVGVLAIGPKLYKEPKEKADIDWTDSVISLKLPNDLDPGEYPVRVIVSDLPSEPHNLNALAHAD
jgi:IPT/TIG domain